MRLIEAYLLPISWGAPRQYRLMHPASKGILRIALHFVTEFLENEVATQVRNSTFLRFMRCCLPFFAHCLSLSLLPRPHHIYFDLELSCILYYFVPQ